MEINYNNGDAGLEADPIAGDCTDLPNTIFPTPGCFFEIPYLNGDDKHYLFTVTNVTDDTIDNEQNFHKISYELEYTDHVAWEELQAQVVETYKFIPGNVGTSNNSVILSSRFDLAEKLDELLTVYRKYYNSLFYNSRVQTYTFEYLTGYNINDSYVIEFLMNNKILNGGSEDYTYVSHKNPVSNTFALDYAKSLYRAFETGDIASISDCYIDGRYMRIDNQFTIFFTRQENYYYVQYGLDRLYMGAHPDSIPNYIETFDPDFVQRLANADGCLYDYGDKKAYLNIIIKYVSGMIPITRADVEALDNVEYRSTAELYYTMPLVMYCIERYIKTLITQHNNN
jgi:hypothetical protein